MSTNLNSGPVDARLQLELAAHQFLVKQLQSYFLQERDEELGDLAGSLLLDFMIKQLGPHLYNKGVQDAALVIQDKLDDVYSLEIVTAVRGDDR